MIKEDFSSEKNIFDFWYKNGFFAADPSSQKKPFSLLIPPPNLTGELHLGHAMQHSILDAVARFKRLQGFDVLLLPGVDHAGIQFEATFDKYLAKQNLSKQKLGREEWIKKAWEFKEEVYKSVSASWRIMGLSADWSREVFTLDDGPKKAVFEQFKTYYDAGLIYKGPYIVQWCPKDQTAIEDVEVEYEERKEKLYYLRYPLKDKRLTTNAKNYITVATVRPETMFADAAVAVNPKDRRYKDLIGEKVVVPFVNREVPIIADETVDIKFGSGAVKVDPAHDLEDFRRAREHNLEIMASVGKDGRLTELAREFAGLKTHESRETIIESLEKKGLLERVEEIKHNVSVCERCKMPTELLISEEWFLKVEDMAKGAIKVIKTGKINFLPKNYARILVDWLSNIHDWCISRSLWWGHRLPVFYCQQVKSSKCKVQKGIIISLEQPKTCPYCGSAELKQDEQVLDTWFSSGLWPLSTLGWPFASAQDKPSKEMPDFDPELKKYFPWDFEISAPEIKFLWIARMIMISNYFTKQIPFKTMFFHGMLRDLQGRKFSKSLGNGIEPQYLVDQWGVDATRMALYTYSVPGRDGRVSRGILDERGKNFRNFATKLRNVARFVIELKPDTDTRHSGLSRIDSGVPFDSAQGPQNDKLVLVKHEDDKWIRDELARLVVKVTNNLERLELHLAVEEIYEFVWHKFADVYIERCKERRDEAQPVLEDVLRTSLILLHPFMPFLTEEIYQKFVSGKKSIMVEDWPV